MLITYLRSSSYNDFSFCQHKYFLTYVLGFKSLAGVAAAKGNIVHKQYEMLARYKKAIQDKSKKFIDDSLGEFITKDFNPNDIEYLNELAFNFYKTNTTNVELTEKDRKECCKWTHKILQYKCGMFNPLLRNILEPEFKFDLEIEVNGDIFGVKGTLDHVSILGKDTIELVDLKTGQPKDWSGVIPKEKGFKDLYSDPQLMMYYWAAHKVFPQYKNIIVSIFFSNHGGVYTLPFTERDIPRCEELIKNRILAIQKVEKPHVNRSWKCKNFCQYSKSYTKDKSHCDFFKEEVELYGIDEVVKRHTRDGFQISEYGSGGGRVDK